VTVHKATVAPVDHTLWPLPSDHLSVSTGIARNGDSIRARSDRPVRLEGAEVLQREVHADGRVRLLIELHP
jgi:hypothetical protein